MLVFLYEFVTGGGFLREQELPPSLLREGRAMVEALAADFVALEGIDVVAMSDARLEDFELSGCRLRRVASPTDERQAFHRLARDADWTVVIAPECDGALFARARWVVEAGGRLLSPPPEVVALATNKQRTAEHLEQHGLPVPRGIVFAPGEPLPAAFAYPAVIKPVDGAGSQDLQLVESAGNAPAAAQHAWRLEQYCPGIAASVAVLCGPAGHAVLPACRQRLANDGSFAYLGGALPLEPASSERAERLATRAIATLEGPLGYVGVDVVLGAAADGSDDVVIEINPRLTTSYVGLRAATNDNLADALLAVAQGREAELTFGPRPLEFDADGTLRWP